MAPQCTLPTAHLLFPTTTLPPPIPQARDWVLQKGQSKRIWGELYKVLDSSDVVIQVQVLRSPRFKLTVFRCFCTYLPSSVARPRPIHPVQSTGTHPRIILPPPVGRGSMLNQHPRGLCDRAPAPPWGAPRGRTFQQKHRRPTGRAVAGGFLSRDGLPALPGAGPDSRAQPPMLIPSPWGAPSGQLPFGSYPAKDIHPHATHFPR